MVNLFLIANQHMNACLGIDFENQITFHQSTRLQLEPWFLTDSKSQHKYVPDFEAIHTVLS